MEPNSSATATASNEKLLAMHATHARYQPLECREWCELRIYTPTHNYNGFFFCLGVSVLLKSRAGAAVYQTFLAAAAQ